MLKQLLFFFCFLFSLTTIFSQGISQKQIERFDEVYNIADSLRRVGEAERSIGVLYDLQHYLESNQQDDPEFYLRQTFIYQDLAHAYTYRNDSLCFMYADLAIEYAKKAKDTVQISQSYSVKYIGLYECLDQREELNFVADQEVKYAELSGHNRLKMSAYIDKCDALIEIGENEEAIIYLEKANACLGAVESDLSVLYGHSAIGNLYNKLGDFEKAAEHHLFGFDLAKEGGMGDFMLRLSRNLSDDYYQLGDYKSAADYALIFGDSTEVTYEALLEEEFALAEAKYNTVAKDKEIAEQKLTISEEQSKKDQLILIGVIAIGIAFVIFQWIVSMQRKKKQILEAELKKEKELSDLRTTFLENIAHEIRTPVTLINGHLDLAMEKSSLAQEPKKHLQQALSNSQRILSNADEILELLKLEKGELPLKEEEIQLNTLFQRLFYSFESLAEIKGVKLLFESTIDDQIACKIDSGRLEKILSNYVSNAIKFSPENGQITFHASIQDESLNVWVKDEGPGIPDAELKKVFQRFYQSTQNKNVGGIGVGLSIAKEYAESLGGSVLAKNENGMVFSVTIPISTYKTELKTAVAPTTKEKESPLTKLNLDEMPEILIVEDNPEMNAYLSQILSTNFSCESAFNGIEALQKVQNKNYQLILSDVMMPQMDGVELKQKVNELENYKTVPFIFVTAKAQMDHRIEGYDLGIDDYIVKPFEKEELLARVLNLLQNKKQRESWIKDNLEFLDGNTNADEQLLRKIKKIIQDNLDNTDFKVVSLAEESGYSQRQLSRFLNKMVGLSPVQYILEIRLKKAHLYLLNKKFGTLAEVRTHVGIASASYFNKKFTERFGVKPASFLDLPANVQKLHSQSPD